MRTLFMLRIRACTSTTSCGPITSTPELTAFYFSASAESTGLRVVENLNGHAYIMSNAQHYGDFPSSINADLKAQLTPVIDRFDAPVGYIGGIPGL